MTLKSTRGVSTLTVIILVAVIALGYTGWNYHQKNQARAAHEATVASANVQMDNAKEKWMDALRLATNTPRIGLAGPIGSLQSIRQGVQQLEVPDCLAPNKQHLVNGMNEALEGMLAFMRNDMGKYELEEYTVKKTQAMVTNFAEYAKKPTPCQQKKT